MKHIGMIVFILGTLLLIIPAVAGFESKITMSSALFVMIAGVALHVFFTRKAVDEQK
ncbi:MAG: hypothetical protein J6Y87_08335 [Muribaculaceae bacterium]|nr:hypothetical protein [Muribaculaceae bacterium]